MDAATSRFGPRLYRILSGELSALQLRSRTADERVEDRRLVGGAGQRRRAVEGAPRDGCHAREAEAHVVREARGRDADERERPSPTVHRLQVDGRVGLRNVELED